MRVLGPLRGWHRALVGTRDLPGSHRPHPVIPTHNVVVSLLAVNAATVVVLLAIIALEGWFIFQARRRGRAAARLHVRIVALFSVIAACLAILVAMVASVTLDRGLDQLFSQQINSVIENSRSWRSLVLREHAYIIQVSLGRHGSRRCSAKPLFDQDRGASDNSSVQAPARGFAAAMIMARTSRLWSRRSAKPTRDS